jgi:gliding motility-associated-like protein
MGIQKIRMSFLGLVLLLLSFAKANANHLFGGEIFYTNVSGNTYKITLVLYGDCSTTSITAFDALPTATPVVEVYNGTSLVSTLTLTAQAGSGVNVSPVCPDEINNTTCTPFGTLPGVKKFIYATTYTLSGTSANWKFRTTGDLGNSQAGRTTAITNANIGTGGSLMSLEATLNNVAAANSSPTYTTVPTPFFCINKPQQYNQGAVDVNNDSLAFALVPGLQATLGGVNSNITYITPYTATAPLGCAPGTFLFSATSGQLSFTPNVIQDALVVSKVSEYRNGVLVGTSMREMTFLVLNNCTNNPPTGPITTPVNGTLDATGTVISTCPLSGSVSFNINPTDPDGDNITITSQGVPAGASLNITSNGTASPSLTFSWDITNVAPGSYLFYLTYTDDGCPLASKQTIAYTIKIYPKPTLNFNILNVASCFQRAKFIITPTAADAPYSIHVSQGSTTVQDFANVTTALTDSLFGGIYTFTLTNVHGCVKDTTIDLGTNAIINRSVSIAVPLCPGGSNGTATVTATGSNPPFTYAIGVQAYGTSNVFTGLASGSYIVHVKDANGCVKDTTITVTNPLTMALTLGIQKPVCSPVSNGQVAITVTNGTSPFQYAINTGTFAASNTFTALPTGVQVLHVKDVNGCLKDTTITLVDSLQMLIGTTITGIQCYGNANGAITLSGSGTTAPYTYAMGTGTLSTTNSFNNLSQGSYTFHLSDANGCLKDTTIALVQPALLSLTTNQVNVKCFGSNTGQVTVNGTGGTSPYSYAADGSAFQTGNVLTGLVAGTHIIHLKDAHSCTKDTTINITQPATAIAFGTFNLTNPTCEGYTDGSVSVAANGGTAPYQFSINNGAFASATNFSSIVEGTYFIKAQDNNGCVIDTSVTLTGYPHILLDGVTMTEPTCNGSTDGQITFNVSGGRPPYTYRFNQSGAWSNSPVFSNKTAGTYVLTVQDNNSCSKDTTITLLEPAPIKVDTASVGNDCNGVNNGGIINLEVTGGTQPYQYIWAGHADFHTASIAGLVNGVYPVKVIDANGCTGDASVEILYNNCCSPFIPNAFTPNGDGNNDKYKVEYIGDMDLREMSIYNRFGERVFYSVNVNQAWDGTYKGGPVDMGTYFYYIRILCGNRLKKELTFKGDITLIR